MPPTTVTYTGTDGAGMTAEVTDLGSWEFAMDTPDGWGEWKDVRRFRVDGPATSYDAFIALNVGGFGINGAHPYIGGIYGGPMRALEKTAGGGRGWTVAVTYSRPPMGIWGDPAVLTRPVVVNFGFTFLRKPTEIDSQGYVVVNSAGDIFDPPQSIDIALLKIRCEMVELLQLLQHRRLVGHVNASSVTLPHSIGTVDARCLNCLNYAPANDIIVGGLAMFTTFEFELRSSKYDRNLIDKGLRAWYNDTGGRIESDVCIIAATPSQPQQSCS